MEEFLLVILIGLVLWALNRLGGIGEVVRSQSALQKHLDELFREVQRLRNELKAFQSQAGVDIKKQPDQPSETIQRWEKNPEMVPEKPAVPILPKEEVVIPSVEQPKEPVIQSPVSEPERIFQTTAPHLSARPVPPPPPRQPELSFWEKFLKNNPDMEKFIGENLINKIGIAILVLGIGYFVKYAIDQEWINEIGRVFIGILAGGALIGIAHRLRQSFSAFSSVLVGGGLSVLYFTIALAFREYGIFSQPVAFVLMVIITGFSVLLSLTYNRIELAVLSLIGGFASPFMLSTGEGNYQVLFTYVLILNVGMLALTYFKKWNLVHLIAYGFTILLYGGWLGTKVVDTPNAPYGGALVFGTLFYGVFMAMNILYNLKTKAKFSVLEITLLLSNTSLYYAAGMIILANIDKGAYQGLFTVLVAAINCGLALVLYKRESVDRNLIFLLVGLVITFISLAVPVQMEGNYITMFWALEAVLLLWFSQKSGLTLVAKGSLVVNGLMLISLFMDWAQVYGDSAQQHPLAIMLNKAFITSLLAVVSLLASLRLLRNQEQPINLWLGKLDVALYRRTLGYLAGGVIYLAGALELNYQLITYVDFSPSRTIILGAYNLLFTLCLVLFAKRQGLKTLSLGASFLGLAMIALYLLLFNPATMNLLREHYLEGKPGFSGFPFHYLSMGLVLAMLFIVGRNTLLVERLPGWNLRIWPWVMGVVLVWVASAELFFHVVYLNFSYADSVAQLQKPGETFKLATRFERILTQTTKVGLPILWGICAFVFMWLGLNRKIKSLRIVSLSLFTLTLVKLFAYDIRGISEGGKIAAFISLGVILLTISFMYQKIRKLILAEDARLPESN